MINGKKVILAAFDEGCLRAFHTALQDASFRSSVFEDDYPRTLADAGSHLRDSGRLFALCAPTSDSQILYIGICRLRNIDMQNKRAIFEIICWDKEASDVKTGIASEALQLLCEYSFSVLGLHSLWAIVREDDLAITLASKDAGWKQIPIGRFFFKNGRFMNGMFLQTHKK